MRSAARGATALLLAVVLLLIGHALRVYSLDAKDLWVDEAHPWWYASLPLLESTRLGYSGGPINSGADPLYNSLLHVWIKLAGDSIFALRYLSVLAGILGAAYLERVTARAFGRRAGQTALLIGVIAPLWVYFAQEVRPYAFIPPLMLVMIEAVIRIDRRGQSIWPWVQLVAGETLSLYAHGFMLFGVLGINIWLGILWLRRIRCPDKWQWFRNWVLTQLASLLLITPSLSTYFARAGGIRNPFASSRTFPEFANELWNYLMGIPWENVADLIMLRLPMLLILVLAGIGLVLMALQTRKQRLLLDVLWLFVGTAFLAMVYAWRDPSFHPRYAVYLTAPLFIFLGAFVSLELDGEKWERSVGSALMICLVASSLLSLNALYSGSLSGYRHPSTRIVADTLRSTFGPQDAVVMVAPHDFTLAYYGIGDVPLGWARFDEGVELPGDTLAFVSGRQIVGVLRNNNEHSDSRRILPFYLERYGSLDERRYFEGYDLSIYHLGSDPELVGFEPVTQTWDGLILTGQSIVSGDAVTVALQWEVTSSFNPGARYATSIRLVDPVTQWTISTVDVLLFDERGNPTDAWVNVGGTTQFAVLPLQPGTPPIEVEVLVAVYDTFTGQALNLLDTTGAPAGQQVSVDTITLGPAPQTWAYGDERPWRLSTLSSTTLAGYALDTEHVTPGRPVGVTLGWRSTPDEVSRRAARIQLVQGDTVVAEDAGPVLQGRAPANVPAGQLWLDHRVLHVSREATPGLAELILQEGEIRTTLASVEISGITRITERPAVENPLEETFGDRIRLLGYSLDFPEPLTSQSTVALTLYWQALEDGLPESNLKVFTQIIGEDGRLVGQHDGVPANDSRPFNSWLQGEYLVDEHVLVFILPYSGRATIQIGLYDPVTLLRVITDDGHDTVRLPLELTVESDD